MGDGCSDLYPPPRSVNTAASGFFLVNNGRLKKGNRGDQ